MSDFFAAESNSKMPIETVNTTLKKAEQAVKTFVELRSKAKESAAKSNQAIEIFSFFEEKLQPMIEKINELQTTIQNTTGITCLIARREMDQLLTEVEKLKAAADLVDDVCQTALRQANATAEACERALLKMKQLNDEADNLSTASQKSTTIDSEAIEDTSDTP